jgi:tetratricopeptide (TPR) repeat protein
MLTILIGLCFVANFDGYNQENGKEGFERILQEHQTEIKKWENTATIIIILFILVGALGLFTAAFRGSDNKWLKRATIIAGLAIPVITLVNNTAFDYDHRILLLNAKQARQLVHEARLLLIRWPGSNMEERNELFGQIQDKLHQIDKITVTIYTTAPSESTGSDITRVDSIGLISTAYAKSHEGIAQQPSWISQPPSDRINIYFVGVGDSPSLNQAKEYSHHNAIELAVDYFILQFRNMAKKEALRFDIDSLSEYLVKSGEVADTYFHFDPAKGFYRYYTLLKLNKKILETDIELFAIREKTHVPKEFQKAIESTQESYEDYYMQRMSVYDNFLTLARETLSPQQYEKFIEGRLLRKDGRYEEAIELLEQVTQENPNFYFGWYNLALAYDDLEDFARANRAYKKAAELEPRQPIRDSSFYNSYGYFLYRHKRYREAIVELEKALEIDPDHPKAKQTLKAAQKAIQ